MYPPSSCCTGIIYLFSIDNPKLFSSLKIWIHSYFRKLKMPHRWRFSHGDPGETSFWWSVAISCYCTDISLSPRWERFTPSHHFQSFPPCIHQDRKAEHLRRAHNARSSNMRKGVKTFLYACAEFVGRRECRATPTFYRICVHIIPTLKVY